MSPLDFPHLMHGGVQTPHWGLFNGDCLEILKDVPTGSVDLVLADLPYGTTGCKWDTVIPLKPLWAHYWRVLKQNGAVVLFGNQPFTTKLITSAFENFRYQWIWEKQKPTNFLQARKMPLRSHEDLSVFYRALPTYNPQGLVPVNIKNGRRNKGARGVYLEVSGGERGSHYVQKEGNFPRSILKFSTDTSNPHPTAKPVPLLEYLIRTYTNPGETVLDNTMGSGATGVAAILTGRRFIGVEMEPSYFQIAVNRLSTTRLSS
jgi:DNA modification methylase